MTRDTIVSDCGGTTHLYDVPVTAPLPNKAEGTPRVNGPLLAILVDHECGLQTRHAHHERFDFGNLPRRQPHLGEHVAQQGRCTTPR